MKLDKKKVEELLNESYQDFDILKEEVSGYADKIVQVGNTREPVKISTKGSHFVKLKDTGESIAYFNEGEMYVGDLKSPLHGDLYIVGRMTGHTHGYAKVKEGEVKIRRGEKPVASQYESRIQFLVQPSKDYKTIEILNVGQNEIEIKELRPNKEEKKDNKNKELGKLWIILPIILSLFLLSISTTSSIGLFLLPPQFIGGVNILLTLLILISLILLFLNKS